MEESIGKVMLLNILCLYLFIFFVTPHGVWDLSSLTRNQTCAPYSGKSLNHWTAREVPILCFLNIKIQKS